MNFDESDIIAINQAHTEKNLWYSNNLQTVKRKLKDYLLTICNCCCYCRRSFQGEFRMVIDIEHILPSSIFRELTFDLNNLSLCCKRCNMLIKKDNIDFVKGNLSKITDYLVEQDNLFRYISLCEKIGDIKKFYRIIYSSSNYKFIHPLLDDYSQHLDYLNIQINNNRFLMYIPKSDKGNYTKDFFALSEFQTRDWNTIQSLSDPENISDFSIPLLL